MFSQNREEEIILAACARVQKGYVLDIGANDGTTLSNSRALIKSGWHGCLVEPDYEAFGKLASLYAGAEGIKLVNAAVDTEGGLTKFHKSVDGGLYSTSYVDERFKDKMIQSYMIPRITPSQIVDLCERGPDAITIDIEGPSFEVMCGLPFPSWDVKVICIEHDGRAIEISGWAQQNGYRVADLNQENVVMVRR